MRRHSDELLQPNCALRSTEPTKPIRTWISSRRSKRRSWTTIINLKNISYLWHLPSSLHGQCPNEKCFEDNNGLLEEVNGKIWREQDLTNCPIMSHTTRSPGFHPKHRCGSSQWNFNGQMEAQLDHPPFSANVIDAQLHPLARYSASYDGRLDCQSSMVCSGGIKFAALNHG
jgi:hypothetical protein